MPFNAIPENKILTKISEFTVFVFKWNYLIDDSYLPMGSSQTTCTYMSLNEAI